METVVPLGDYIINNTLVHFELTIKMYNNLQNYYNPGMLIYIQLPNNYPKTTLSMRYDDNAEKYLFYAIITVSEIGTPTFEWFVNYIDDDYYDEDINHVVMIREFYIHARQHHISLLKEEENFMRGLGKRCLCLAMPYLIDYYQINQETAAIALLANGGIGLYQYYTKTYSFQPIYNTRTVDSMFMVTELSTFLSHCET